ncbi:MAG: hypothetical protein GXP55_17980 [Deltaproteobacteria bacterium]|nr:hypothetical protein [Deltaproteobacteria bacterium]
MPASAERLEQLDAQLDALGVDEEAARAVVSRLLEQRSTSLEEIDAALSSLAEGLALPPSPAPSSHSELPLAEQEPGRSTDELSLDDLELPSEELAAPPPASALPPPPVPSEPAPRPASALPPPPIPSEPAPRPASALPPPPVPSEPAPRPASALPPPPVPSEPAPAIAVATEPPAVGLDADDLFGEMSDVGEESLELELDSIVDEEVEAFGFEEEDGEATGLFTADDLAAIQSERPPAVVETLDVDDDFDLLIDDGEIEDVGLEEIELSVDEDSVLADAAAVAEVGDAEPHDDDDPEKKEGGFFKKLFG